MTKMIMRRNFLKAAGAIATLAAIPRAVQAAVTPLPRVVVVGGGFGGATLAKYLRMWGADIGGINVTLIDTNPSHVSCVLSNLVVNGTKTLSSITLGYTSLKNRGVTFVQGTATSVNPALNTVRVQPATGAAYDQPYDHLVMSPGIDFLRPPVFTASSTGGDFDSVHAWRAGPQTTWLKNQLAAMKNNQTFVMTVPKSPYRCPPGPYERACIVADYLKSKKYTGAKVIVLDANASIQAEPEGFGYAFNTVHKGIIQYVPNAKVDSVNLATKSITVTTDGGATFKSYTANVLNYIPNQKAGSIAAPFADASGFVPVEPLSYSVKQAIDGVVYSNVHVIGDACKLPGYDLSGKPVTVPKSAHMANSEAKVCADAIIRSLGGFGYPDDNIATNSACYSPITKSVASWLSTSFVYGSVGTAPNLATGMIRTDLGEAPLERISSDGFQEMFIWANNLFADSFT